MFILRIYCLSIYFSLHAKATVHRIHTTIHRPKGIQPFQANLAPLSIFSGSSTAAYMAYAKSLNEEVNYDSNILTPHLRCMAISTTDLRKTTGSIVKSERLIAEVTLGTPRQGPFWMMFDLFKRDGKVTIYDDDRNDKSVESITFYNSKKSSTFTNLSKEDWGADVFQIGLIYANLSFEMDTLSNINGPSMDEFVYKGSISLYTQMKIHYESQGLNYSDLALFQLRKSIDQPIFALWNDRWNRDKSAQITMGELDQENCVDNWSFTPRLYDMSVYNGKNDVALLQAEGYLIYLESVTMDFNGTIATVDIRKRVLLQYWSGNVNRTGSMPYHLKFFFVYASGASYNSTTGKYEMDCAITGAQSVTLNFADPYDKCGDARLHLVMLPRDYIYFDPNIEKCVVAVEGYPQQTDMINWTIRLPYAFWNNHCFAYNFELEQVGFADVKKENDHMAQINIISDFVGFDHKK